MSLEFAYRIREDAPATILRDLDVVVLTVGVIGDEGAWIEAGTEGTIVSVYNAGEAFVVEVDRPEGSLVTLPSACLKLVERV